MNWYKQAQSIKAYHGTTKNFETFDINYTGEGTDQEGPGIYFTSDPQDASGYAYKENDEGSGGRVFPVYLNFRKTIPLNGDININEIKKLVLLSMNLNNEEDLHNIDMDKFWDSPLSNWSEDPYSSYIEAVNNIIEYNANPHDAFQSVWYDFYRDNSADYLKNMVQLGYDGIIIPKNEGVTHYIVFNPSIIQSTFSK